jgi:hypothetical protein
MKKDLFKKPQVWCFSTYFAEGLPYAVVRLMSSVFFTDIGMKERYIGYLNFLGVPWNLKFLWAPFLDIFGKKRTWMICFQGLITLCIACIAFAEAIIPLQGDTAVYAAVVAMVFVVLAFVAATNDIAIDGYYMEGLHDPREQALYTGYRVFAYRLGMILVRSGFVAIAAFAAARTAGASKFAPWSYAFGAAALTMFCITMFHALKLPQFEAPRTNAKASAAALLKEFGAAFITYSRQERFALVIIFIVMYKIGDELLFSMGTPFLMRELGVTKAQFAWLGGLLGAFGAIAGTTIGGIWIKKKGLKRSIWPLSILMNFNIWAYIWLAFEKPSAASLTGIWTIALVHCYEQMAAGLGNAVLVVFILRTCKPQFKASHYAIGSAIMSLFSTFFGGFSGIIVEHIGYLHLFIGSFLVSIPSMALLFWVPIKEEIPE